MSNSKKAQAIKIAKRMLGRKNVPSRAQILDEMVAKIDGMSRNCAATYFQNITSGKEGWS